LKSAQEKTVSQSDLGDELGRSPTEPLLPIEKKLIGWSFGIGIALLIILLLVNQLFPPAS
jgi:hypothetical protein